VSSQARWLSLAAAAVSLDMRSGALRRTLERRARRAADGVIEAAFDGIRARKFAGRWRVKLGPGWDSEEHHDARPVNRSARAKPTARPTHATGLEKE
jgi:hypothetical protein